jgi:hypothetical protein
VERSTPPRAGDHPQASAGDRAAWWLPLLALMGWQVWMTLSLFGGEQPWKRLLDDQPLLSGRHPLHLYHGYLGAGALRQHGSLSCFDPTFHAGYPKTPVFDSGSRPAELLLTLAGGRYSPAAYKIGVAGMCLLVPLLLFAAARNVGLHRAAACLACLFGLLVWWGQPCRELLEAGDLDLLLAALLGLAQAGFLIRYDRDPGPLSWLGVVSAALLGWFAHPLVLLLLLPLFLVYYLSVGARHRLGWHLALLSGLLVAVAVNGFWLIDWIGNWWICVPVHPQTPLLAEPSLRTIWVSSFWGGPVDKAAAIVLVLAATGGVLVFNETRQRATARLLGLAWSGFLALAVAGLVWEPLGRFDAPRLLAPALLFAAIPAAHALSTTLSLSWRWRAGRWASLAATVVVVAVLVWAPPPALASWAMRLRGTTPLQLGLDNDQQAIVAALREHTTTEARIVWEDGVLPPLAPHWTPLLPLLTERAYVGGLDAQAGIEYVTNGLVDGLLMGRPMRDWKDEELREYCERYNVGWLACWSPASCARLRQWSSARLVVTLPPRGEDEPPGCLFAVRRQRYSFALIGSARWLSADPRRIVLGDVVPQCNGSVKRRKNPIVLSLHYQEGMRVAPSRVRLERYSMERAGSVLNDSRPFVRLWIDEPVTRITITWDKR